MRLVPASNSPAHGLRRSFRKALGPAVSATRKSRAYELTRARRGGDRDNVCIGALRAGAGRTDAANLTRHDRALARNRRPIQPAAVPSTGNTARKRVAHEQAALETLIALTASHDAADLLAKARYAARIVNENSAGLPNNDVDELVDYLDRRCRADPRKQSPANVPHPSQESPAPAGLSILL